MRSDPRWPLKSRSGDHPPLVSDQRRGDSLSDDTSEAGVDISIIVVSWNVKDFLRGCLESIHATRGTLRVETIVVDNDSTDGSAEMVRHEFPDVDLLESETNLGFAAANNVGLARARGLQVFFLNPDTLLHQHALSRLFAFLDISPDIDMVGPRLILPDGRVQRECARRLPTLGLTLFEAFYLHRFPLWGARWNQRLISPYDLDETREVEAISGAAMFARRRVLQELGGFDESFMHTGEDMDLCLRLRRRGSRIWYAHDAEVVHFWERSSSRAWIRAGTMSIISMGNYFRRSRGPLHAWTYRLIVQLIKMPMYVLIGATRAVLRRDLDDLRQRMRFATAVWMWRVSD